MYLKKQQTGQKKQKSRNLLKLELKMRKGSQFLRLTIFL